MAELTPPRVAVVALEAGLKSRTQPLAVFAADRAKLRQTVTPRLRERLHERFASRRRSSVR